MTVVLRQALVALALVVVATWPFALGMHDHVGFTRQHPDVQCGMWWPWHVAHALTELRDPFRAPELSWPHGQDVTLLLWNIGAQLVFLPVHLLAGPPLGPNLASLLTPVINGLAAAWAARLLTRSEAAGWAALVVAVTDGMAFSEGLLGRPEQALWAPNAVYLAALARVLEESPGPDARRHGTIAAAALAAAGAVYWFHAYFLVVLTVLAAAVLLVARRLDRPRLLALVRVAGLSACFVAPFALPIAYAALTAPQAYESLRASVPDTVAQQVVSSLLPQHLLWPVLPAVEPTRHLSLLALPVLGWAAFQPRSTAEDAPARTRGPSWTVALFGLAALVFAMGPVLGTYGADAAHGGARNGAPLRIGGASVPLPGALLNLLPGYARLWWPYRWEGVAMPAVALCAGALVGARPRARMLTVGLAAFGAAQLAVSVRTGQDYLRPYASPPIYAAIAAMPGPAPVLVVRGGGSALGEQPLLGQPISTGVAAQVPNVTAQADNMLVRALRDGTPIEGPWTEETSGGFHYVLVPVGRRRPGRWPGLAVERVLGKPFHEDDERALWVVPGVGTVPPG